MESKLIMAELLLITPQEITKTTVMGGQVDIDKYLFAIHNNQKQVIEPLLGTELYEKIKTDFTNATLSGLYLELYEKFVKPILKNYTAATYIEVASYTVDNGGIYQHQAENTVIPDRQEIEKFANSYRSNVDVDIQRFEKWICKNPLPEYKTYQDEVNANRDSQTMNGWYFGSAQDPTRWGRYTGTIDNKHCNLDCDERYP